MVVVSFDDFIKINISCLGCVIGEFDGIHIGHLNLINKMIEICNNKNLKKAVITFEPHPDLVLNKEEKVSLITPFDEKISELKKLDIDFLIVINFDEKLLNTSPNDFVNNYLMKLNVKEVVVGYDFTFGYLGNGRPKDIEKYSNAKINVTEISKIEYNGDKVSSTLIKKLLKEGFVEVANELLGRPFRIKGQVVEGKRIGRTINLPTANVLYNNDYVPILEGVYGVIVTYNNKKFIGLANCGHNPSFNYKKELNLEINIIDFNESIYGKSLIVDFITFIRKEMKFSSMSDFLSQIEIDKNKIIDKVQHYLEIASFK